MLCSDGVEHRILQENRAVLVHPGREAEELCAWAMWPLALGCFHL